MTRAEHAPWMDSIDPVAVDAVRSRWRAGMPDDDLQRLALALTVACARCDAPRGEECRSFVDGQQVRYGFHHIPRGRDAGVQWPPTSERERVGELPRRRRGDGWPDVPPPVSDEEDDQGWRR